MWKILILALASCAVLSAQEKQPQVRLNILNVCAPADPEKADLAAGLARIPASPKFGPDFEIARGRSTDAKRPTSDWVRLRHEFAPGSPFSNVQFLVAVEGTRVTEALVFHARESKPGEPLQVAIEDDVAAANPAHVLASDTPPQRVRLERFGKPSLVLARCPQTNQAGYESLFRTAADVFARYRTLLNVRTTVSAELSRIKAASAAPAPVSKTDSH